MKTHPRAADVPLALPEAAPAFWPPGDRQQIGLMELDRRALPTAVVPVMPRISRLRVLADALRAMQQIDGRFIDPDVAAALLRRSADLLLEIAGELPFEPAAAVLELRARGLRGDGAAREEAARRQAEISVAPIVLLCGPLATWTSKSDGRLHSLVAAVPDERANFLVHRAGALLPDVLAHLGRVVESDLTIENPPGVHVTELVACGGEANTYPKHFAYFLPEDEGVRAERTATVVFANVYVTRFGRVSAPMLRALTAAGDAALDRERTTQLLLLWFRGHDLGHFLRLRGRADGYCPVLGRQATMMLHEAAADVMGYLAMATGPWQRRFGVTPHESACVFLAELFRYLRRGAPWFADSAAAFLELSFLASTGAVRISADASRLSFDPAALRDGMIELGGDLVDSLLRRNERLGRRLVVEHGPRPDHPLAPFASALAERFRHLPTAMGYEPGGARSPAAEEPALAAAT